MKRKPKYETRSVPPLSDGRTPGVCKNCGKQHPTVRDWELANGTGCNAADAVLPARGE